MSCSRIAAVSWILAASVASLLACTNHSADEPRPRSEPLCDVLPAELPLGAVIKYSRRDTEQNPVYDVAYVADADCPEADVLVSAPECVRLTQEAMQVMWTTLHDLEVHRIEMVPVDGTCFHCGSRWITVKWPGGACSKGFGFEVEISVATDDRFSAAVVYLDGVSERTLGSPPATN
jgi:hypothetical protein